MLNLIQIQQELTLVCGIFEFPIYLNELIKIMQLYNKNIARVLSSSYNVNYVACHRAPLKLECLGSNLTNCDVKCRKNDLNMLRTTINSHIYIPSVFHITASHFCQK